MYLQQHATTTGLIASAGFVTGWGMEQSLGFALLAGVGAAVAGLMVARLFGEGGALGWALAMFAAILATGLGAGLVGGVIFGARGSELAIAGVAEFLWSSPLDGLRWLTLMGVAQWVAVGEAQVAHNSRLAKQ